MEKLKKNDIIFNAELTRDLIRTGKTASRGKVALANGTTNGMPAFGDNVTFKKPTTKTGSTSSGSGGSGGSSGSGGSGGTENAIKKGLDAFNALVQKLFDWIEVKLSREERKIDRLTSKAEYRTYLHKNENNAGYVNKDHENGKNDLINSAMAILKSLKQDNKDGADKYFAYANGIRAEAISNKLVTAKLADDIIDKIKNGTIDISKYDDNVKTFISAYQEWYEKGLQCLDNLIEINQQLRDLEQTKLDNITERFETLAGYSESLQGYAESMVNYYNAIGRKDNSPDIKLQYNKQLLEQNRIVAIQKDAMNEYYKEMMKAQSIFGKDSNEFKEALTQYNEMKAAYVDARTREKELQKELYELDFKPIEYAMNKLLAFGDKLSSIVGLKEARGTIFGVKGTRITEGDYIRQINNNDRLVKLYAEDRQKRLDEIKALGYKPGSGEWETIMEQVRKDDEEILKLLTDTEGLKDSIVELRWKPFRELSDQLDENISDFDHLRSLMDESQFFDERGKGFNFTKRGLENIALIGEAMDANDQKNMLYRKGLQKLEKEYHKGNISLEEFTERLREYKQVIQETATANKQYEDELVNLYKTKITHENDALQEQINKRKEALQQTKSYYDYLDSIKDKNKDINLLRALINALEGVTDMASQARLATLRAQLAEKEEDLNKTRRDHDYEIQQTGYDKMSQDANKVLDDEIARVESNAGAAQLIVKNMLGELKGDINSTKKQINNMVNNTGTIISETTLNSVKFLKTNLDEAKKLIEDFLKDKTTKSAIDILELIKEISTKQIKSKNGGKAVQDAEVTASDGKTNPTTPKQNITSIINTGNKSKNNNIIEGNTNLWNFLKKYYGVLGDDNLYLQLAKATKVTWPKLKEDETIDEYNKRKKEAMEKIYDILVQVLGKKGFAKGTLGTKKNELNWTHEGEIIRRSDGAILRQLPAGTQVVPKITSENLMKWGLINPNEWAANIAKSLGSVSNSLSQSTNVYYDSVIHVDGSVDVDVMDRLEELGKGLLNNKSFTQGTVNIITKEYKREARKTGMR